MNPRPFRAFEGFSGGIDVLLNCSRQPANRAALDDLRYLLDRLEVARRGDGESGFDNVYAQPLELPSDLQLLLNIQRSPRRLLPIPQRGVKNENSVRHYPLRDSRSRFTTVLVVGRESEKSQSSSNFTPGRVSNVSDPSVISFSS